MERRKKGEREWLVEQIAKQIGKEFNGGRWEWHGAYFVRVFHGKINDLWLYARFDVDLKMIRATVYGSRYGLEDEIRTFLKIESLDECARWTAEKFVAVYETVSARIAPYEEGYNNYNRALRGIQ